MEKRNFTRRWLETLPAPRRGRVHHYDAKVRGLGVAVYPTGRKTFFLYRKVQGWPERITIGTFPDLDVEAARGRASELNARIARGENPARQGGSPTLGELFRAYAEQHLRVHAKNPERAARLAEWQFEHYLAPWKGRKAGSIRRAHVARLHAEVGERHGRTTANRLVELLRAAFNHASRAELWRGENPASGVRKFQEPRRTRFLQPDELARLLKALDTEPSRDLRDYVLLALFTGARRSDVLAARWEQLAVRWDKPRLAESAWTIPEPKSQQPYTVPLAPRAVEVLAGRRKDAKSEWVFPSRGRSGHVVDLKGAWKRLLQRAGVAGLRQHDLRRTLGSWQAARGTSLPIIGKALGHRSLAATQVYAQLNLDPVREAVDGAVRAMLAATRRALPRPQGRKA